MHGHYMVWSIYYADIQYGLFLRVSCTIQLTILLTLKNDQMMTELIGFDDRYTAVETLFQEVNGATQFII